MELDARGRRLRAAPRRPLRPGLYRRSIRPELPALGTTLLLTVLTETHEYMISTQVPEPFHRDGWVYEEKVDGWRILAYKGGASVRLVSRTGVEHSKRFRGVAALIRS
jgi:hypothetical protein